MAFKKYHLFDPDDQQTCHFARAISHPVRLDMLRYLDQMQNSKVEYFFNKYPLSKSTISDHLKVLREAHLVQYREEYPYIIYSLDRGNFEKLIKYLLDYCQKF